MGLGRRFSAQGRVRPRAVEVGDPAADEGARLGAGLEGLEVDALVFERTPEPLDEDVVEPAPVHRDAYADLYQHLGEGRA